MSTSILHLFFFTRFLLLKMHYLESYSWMSHRTFIESSTATTAFWLDQYGGRFASIFRRCPPSMFWGQWYLPIDPLTWQQGIELRWFQLSWSYCFSVTNTIAVPGFVRLVHRCLLNLMLLIDRFPANAINIDHGKSRPYLLFPCIDEGQGSTKNSRYVKYRVENISWKTIYELTAQFQITDFPWFGLVYCDLAMVLSIIV